MLRNAIIHVDELKYYLKDLKKIPVITHERQIEIFKRITDKKVSEKEKEKLKKELVTGNLRFVITIAKIYQNHGAPLMDLISEGNIGLIKALERFDYSSEIKFISYAVWWIRQSILLYLNENGRTIRIPSNKIHDYQKSKKSNDDNDCIYIPFCIGLNEKINEDGDELIDLIQDPNEQRADILLNSREELNKCLANVLCVLSERERIIIEKSFGMNGTESSLEDLGEEFNCTKERVRQLKDKAIKKLRNESLILSKYL
jgi:RNA polymerase primary sigma factor